MIDQRGSPLLTDFYQLNMLQTYYERGMEDLAVFEFFVRRLPAVRSFLVAAGLEQLIQFLTALRFSGEELDWIRSCGHFSRAFADRLADLRFTGSVDALPEGTVFFPHEPLVRITAALPEAQLVESRLINLINFQTLVASKAARIVLAAPGKVLVDFGLRRAHGAEAALLAARACYLAGFSGTANVLAGREFGIPLFGTMAHSFIQAHRSETAAFEHFAMSHPRNVTLLIDTYDTEAAALKVVRLAPSLESQGISLHAVRIDSGDLAAHAKAVRAILDQGGLSRVEIFASGALDEYRIRELSDQGAPIDGFGVGGQLDTSADVPVLDCAYKLVEYAGEPRRKRSEGKATWPGRKQVFRRYRPDGIMAGDALTLEGEVGDGDPLVRPVMARGARIDPPEALEVIRARVAGELERLPPSHRGLAEAPSYSVTISSGLGDCAALADRLALSGGG